MKSCNYEKWIHRFIDEELDKGSRSEFEGHLSSCSSCRKEISALKGIKSLLSSAKEDLSFPELKYKVLEGIDKLENSSLQMRFQLAFLYGRVAPAAITIAILFTILSVWDVQRFYSETDSAMAFLEDRDIQIPELDFDIL